MKNSTAKVYRDVPRVSSDLIARLNGLTVADLHDALSPMARSAGLLDPRVQPVAAGMRICGQAVTAFCTPGDSLMAHCALYFACPGDVVVLSNGGVAFGALWGGYGAFDAKTFGVAGTIVDGPVRDVAYLRELQYPVWASSICVSRTEKLGRGYVNMPVSCGGCLINPGDIIIADDDGVLAFAPEKIGPLASAVRSKLQSQSPLRAKIAEGGRLFETQNFGALLEAQGIEIQDGDWRSKLARPL